MDTFKGIRRYLDTIHAFVAGDVSADEFEKNFLAIRREIASNGIFLEGEAGEILDELFYDVDAYTTLVPRKPNELDADGLLISATKAMHRLEPLNRYPRP